MIAFEIITTKKKNSRSFKRNHHQPKTTKKTSKKFPLTFSISKSLPRFCPLPLPTAGSDECLSSLPCADPKSDPTTPRFFDAAAAAAAAAPDLGTVRWRAASVSLPFFRFLASSLFSSVSLSRRSWATQESHLCGLGIDEVRNLGCIVGKYVAEKVFWKKRKNARKDLRRWRACLALDSQDIVECFDEGIVETLVTRTKHAHTE